MRTSRKRILIVENDPDMLFILDKALNDAGYDVEPCKAGFEIAKARNMWPHLFIVDKDFPAVDGMALCQVLRIHEKTKHIPIIMISSYQVKNKAKQIGVDEFIRKPFELNQLLQTVDVSINSLHNEEKSQ